MIHRGIVLFLFFLVLNVSGKPSPLRKMILSPGASVTTQSIVGVDMSMSTACLDCPLKGASKLNRNPDLKESDPKTPIEKAIGVGDAMCALCEEYDKPEEKLNCKKKMCSSV